VTGGASPAGEPPEAGPADGGTVIIRLGGKTVRASHRRGSTLLQTARSAGLRAPSSCEAGTCATCMARCPLHHRAGRRRQRRVGPV